MTDKAVRPQTAFQRIWQKHSPCSGENLDTIVSSVETGRDSFAVNYLAKLGTRYTDACAEIVKLSQSTNADTRIRAIQCLEPRTADETEMHVLRSLLKDRSYRVRESAVTQSIELRCHHLLPELYQAHDAEPRDAVRQSISIGIDVLAIGYSVRDDGDGSQILYVLARTGLVVTELTPEDLQNRGLAQIVDSWKRF